MTLEERKNRGREGFLSGYNCAQAVVLAFSDLLSLNEECLMRLASPFGGGMGRMREVCGGFSGAVLVIGLLYGYSTPETGEIKKALYEKVQGLGKVFIQENTALTCREITQNAVMQKSEVSHGHKLSCADLVAKTIEELDSLIKEYPVKGNEA